MDILITSLLTTLEWLKRIKSKINVKIPSLIYRKSKYWASFKNPRTNRKVIYLQPFYKKMFGYKEGDFPVTEDVTRRTIALPFFSNLTEEQIDYVVEKLKEGIKRNS